MPVAGTALSHRPAGAAVAVSARPTILAIAWRTASRLRNATTQVRGRASDSLPHDVRERAAVAHICGYRPGESDVMVNDYLRVTRRARQVVERMFWG